jgi:nitroreductase
VTWESYSILPVVKLFFNPTSLLDRKLGMEPYHLPEHVLHEGRGVAARPNPPADRSFLQIVDQRVCVRSFTNKPVQDQVLENCLRVARLAPSAGNLQAYQVVIVRGEEQRIAIAQAAVGQFWIAQAPLVLVFVADLERSARKYHGRGRYLYAVQDATIAAAYTQLALEAAGLSSCWVGAFQEERVAEIVGINPTSEGEEPSVTNFRPVVVMPVGYAADRHKRLHRRSLVQFVHHDVIRGKEKHGAKRVREEKVNK